MIYPGFLWLNVSPTPAVLFTVVGLLSIALVVQTVPGITMLPEMFPKHVRASGMSLVYSVGVALFGGFSPFISTWLVERHRQQAGAGLVPARDDAGLAAGPALAARTSPARTSTTPPPTGRLTEPASRTTRA